MKKIMLVLLLIFIFFYIIKTFHRGKGKQTGKQTGPGTEFFKVNNITSNAIITPGKKISYKKITGITINSISITLPSQLTQPEEVLVIYLKIYNDAGAVIYLNQIYENADYSFILNAVTFVNDPNGFGTLSSKILSAVNSEYKYASFEILTSKYKTGFPRTKHEPLDFAINLDIVHEMTIYDIIELERQEGRRY